MKKEELRIKNGELGAIRGIRRGLDEMKAGQGEPARKVLDRIRAKHNIPRSRR